MKVFCNTHAIELVLTVVLVMVDVNHKKADGAKNNNLTTGLDAYMYAEYCGIDKFCTSPNITLEEKYPISSCPSCYCDDRCASRGDCCPDKYMSRCVNTTIVYGSSSDRHGFMIIDTCSDYSNSSLLSLCSRDVTLQSMFDFSPVSSFRTKLSYKNRYCAECNNEKEYVTWNFEVHNCRHSNFDINYYSSLESIEVGLKQYSCDFSLFPPDDFFPRRCDMSFKLDQCNVTGLWKTWDESIEKACIQYNAPYQIFKNIFCYICNYGSVNTLNLIDKCYMNNDMFQNELCENGKNAYQVFPYRNTLCRECNRILGIHLNFYKHVHDFIVSAERPYRASVTITLKDVCDLPKNILYSSLYHSNTFEKLCGPFNVTDSKPNIPFETNRMFYHYEMPVDVSDVDMSSLYERYKQYGGVGSWCNHGTGKNLSQPCSCDKYCFLRGTCCPDMLLNMHVECTDKLDGNFISIVTKCPEWSNDRILIYYCERNSSVADSILDTTPVYDTGAGVEYRNIFCLICNQRHNSAKVIGYSNFREIDFKCDQFLEIENFLPLHSTFTELHKLCKIGYFPYQNIPRKTCKNSEVTSPCQRVPSDTNELSDITHLCENTGIYIFSRCEEKYQNIFCEMCDVMANVTNVTSVKFLPFDVLNEGNVCFKQDMEIGGDPPYCQSCVSQRYLFSLYDAMHKVDGIPTEKMLACKRNQYEDLFTGKCRDIKCSPGKLYQNYTCEPFLQWTTNLNYGLHFKLRPRNLTVISAETVGDLIVDLGLSFRSKFANDVLVRKDYYVATKGCAEKPKNLSLNEFEIYAFILLSVHGPVSRAETEKKLQIVTLTAYTYFDVHFGNLIARNLPTMIDSMDNSFCKQSSDTKYGSINGFLFLFDKFLSCPQLSLRKPDAELINDRLNLRITHLDRILGSTDFQVINSMDIRVCIDDFQSIPTEISTLRYALNIFSVICSAISMICLLATFIIYSFFSQLRTLPGKNLMTLTSALFIAHLSTLIGSQELSKGACIIMGCCIHYSWLLVFCSSSNCSVHMMRAFNGKLVMSSNAENSVKYRNALTVVLTIPFVVVLSYCMVSYYVTEMTPYTLKGCFIKDVKYMVAFFISPVFFMCIMNMLLFFITFYHIRSVPKTESNIKKRRFTLIFFKLFIITGVTWLFQLIDGFFPPSLFSFIVAAMNGGQGLFIFLSYACNKYVYSMMTKCYRRPKSDTYNTSETKLNGCQHNESDGNDVSHCPVTIHQTRL